MEFEGISEQFEWEVRRVATAFGLEEVKKVNLQPTPEGHGRYSGASDEMIVSWRMKDNQLHFLMIEDVKAPREVDLLVRGDKWTRLRGAFYGEHVVRGFYRLGIEEEAILSQLPALSTHEELELRLSMPREFWPQKWVEEELTGK